MSIDFAYPGVLAVTLGVLTLLGAGLPGRCILGRASPTRAWRSPDRTLTVFMVAVTVLLLGEGYWRISL